MRINPALIAPPLYRLYRLWCASLRYTEHNRAAIEQHTEAGRPVVLCLWHDELFPLIYLKRQLRIVTVVSASRDGEFLAGVLQRMGLETARGSSSREGLRALLHTARRMLEDGVCACLTLDGPRGPRHQAKEGAVFLACKTGAPLVPIRLYMDRAWRFGSWDRFQLPWPGSRVRMICGEAYHPACELKDAEGMARESRLLGERLEALTDPGPCGRATTGTARTPGSGGCA